MKKNLLIIFILLIVAGKANAERFNKLVWRPLETRAAESYSLTITANNVNGAARGNAVVVLYDSSNIELARVTTNSSGQATFSSLENGTYTYEVYYTPTLTDVPVADNKEFWGNGTITMNGSPVTQIFTRIAPYISADPTFNPAILNTGQQSSGSFTVKNPLPNTADSYIAVWVDRDKVSPWDYSSNSPATVKSISMSGTSAFSFNITPTNNGTYSCYAFVYTKINGTFMITDQYNWTQAFSLITSISQITWSGFTWKVKSGLGGPGPNNWNASSSNIWVDGQGNLHLKIIKMGNKWYCSEISLLQSLGYGEYTFEVSTNVENLDKNIILGLFTYETDSKEIDIEFSKWGNSANVDGWYTIQPPPYNTLNQKSFALNLSGDYSTHKFKWNASEIYFQSYHGHSQDNLIKQWSYKGANNPPAGNEKLHLNFWLFQGNAPSNGQEAEVVIKSFKFENLLSNSSQEELSNTPKNALYPNPTKGLVHLSLDQSIEGDVQIDVYNTSGLMMQSKNISSGNNFAQIDLSGYSNGIYLINIGKNNNLYFRKILKE